MNPCNKECTRQNGNNYPKCKGIENGEICIEISQIELIHRCKNKGPSVARLPNGRKVVIQYDYLRKAWKVNGFIAVRK